MISTPDDPIPKAPEVTPRKEKDHETRISDGGKLGGLVLKFPQVAESFRVVRDAFLKRAAPAPGFVPTGHKSDIARLCISHANLLAILRELGFAKLADDEIALSELFPTDVIGWREFLTGMGNCYEAAPEASRVVRNGFHIVREAFKKIDADHGGSLDVNEMKMAFFEAAGASPQTEELLEKRFSELDIRGTGRISIMDFTYGIFNWVGMLDED